MDQTIDETPESFHSDMGKIGIYLSPKKLSELKKFYITLKNKNADINLTSIIDWNSVLKRHFLDSATLALAIPELLENKFTNILDLGSGAGIPGIPLKIMFPNISITMLDSTAKKTDFIRHSIKTLNLIDAHVLEGRAEIIGHELIHREHYDYVISRAVAPLPILLEYMIPLTTSKGKSIAMKGESVSQEIDNSQFALSELNSFVDKKIQISNYMNNHSGQLLIIRKYGSTNLKYPRRNGVPSKSPLVK